MKFRKLTFRPVQGRINEFCARVGRYQTYTVWRENCAPFEWHAMNLEQGRLELVSFPDQKAAEAGCQTHFENWVTTTFFQAETAVEEPVREEVAVA